MTATQHELAEVGDGLRLRVHRSGSGAPAVVCVSCAGGAHEEWADVARRLRALAQVVTYGRPGLGGSDPLPAETGGRLRSIGWAAAQLRTLLQRTGIASPYLLLTSSIGGWIADQYAARWPAEVAGLVLVDPTNLSSWPMIVREPMIVDGDDDAPGCIRFSRNDSYAELQRATPAGAPRCAVVSSSEGRWERQPPGAGEFCWWEPLTLAEVDQLWQRYQRDWVRRLAAQHVVADTAGHFVHRDEPALVAHVVEAVIDAARRKRPVELDPVAVAAHAGRLQRPQSALLR